MKHNLQLSALSNTSNYKVKNIYFTSKVNNSAISPLDKLVQIWSCIKHSLHDEEINETILIFKKPYSNKSKRLMTGSYNEIQVKQFSSFEAESRKFTSIIKVLKILIVNLSLNKSTTKRDVYYQDVTLFKKNQNLSNELIELISHSLGFSIENDLLICASQKGLIYGNISIKLKNDCHLDLHYSDNPILIPLIHEHDKFELIKGECLPIAIIVIEKEAIFKSFCNYIKSLDNPLNLIVITGKGFPDKLTKKFIALLVDYLPKVPVLGFMDSDVYGISICKNYKFGGLKNQKDSCFKMILAGVFLLDYKQGWLDISNRDFKMMINFIKDVRERICTESDTGHIREFDKWHRELTRGLILFKKSEMNVIDNELSINQYILNKINIYT